MHVSVSVALVPDRAPTVLVVDDSDVIRSLIVLNLELEGFDVYEARDGQECLDVVERVAPDLVTLDVAMPRRDGFSTLEALRANPATAAIPIVIVSARAQGADLTRGAELGVNAYLTKPFEPSELIQAVRSLMTGPSTTLDTMDG
jgi:CheY-like chemotaxis protein